MTIAKPTIGVFGYLFDRKGELLLKRRGKDESLPGDWDLPGGGVEFEIALGALDERLVREELAREIKEETGIEIPLLQAMPPMYPAISKKGRDWAFGIMVGEVEIPETENIRYVSLDELEELANGPIGNRLVSGVGKRMHRLCLRGIASRDSHSPDQKRAGERLQRIQTEWEQTIPTCAR